jgi:hypothetical protein
VQFRDWSKNSGGFPQGAVRNAVKIGDSIGVEIASSGYTNVLLIGHSAGAWMVNEIAKDVNAMDIPVSVTFLDPFVPSAVTVIKPNSTDKLYTPDKLGAGIPMVEQYFHTNFTGWGIANVLPNAANYDISALQACVNDKGDWHGWPIRWYTLTTEIQDYDYGFGLGYQDAFNIQGTKGSESILSCADSFPSSAPTQNQTVNTLSQIVFSAQNALAVEAIMPLMPPLPDISIFSDICAGLTSNSSDNMQSSSTPSYGQIQSLGSSPLQPALDEIPFDTGGGQISGTELAFSNLNVLAQGGDGAVSTGTNGVQMSTTIFVWETFDLSTTNIATLGAIDYTLSIPCNTSLGMWMDGKPMQCIQSSTNDDLTSLEMFPLSSALGTGNHLLTVSLESLDGTPITATLNSIGFYNTASRPSITSQSVSNDQFSLSWEVGAGLKYQPQYNNDLTSTNWWNMGELLTSPTNAIMSAFDIINTNKQRFYRIELEQ